MSLRLTETQQSIVDYSGGPLLVLAGPGSGKTRVLTERIRKVLATPSQHFRVLALTFTNKAANEMKERLEDVPDAQGRAFVGTLHSFCMEVLANRGKSVGIDGLPNIFESFDDRRQILATAVSSSPYFSRLLATADSVKDRQKLIGSWLDRISELKSALIFPSMIDNIEEKELYELYDAELRASNAVDYDDLLLLTYRLFEERPKIADLYRRQYKYIFIDEAQDLNETQYRLLLSLCGTNFENIMMVGDPRQAIYVWNGADPKYLDLFESDFNAKKIILTENFRCSREVVEAASKLDDAYSVEGQLPIQGLVQLFECDDETVESKAVVSKIQDLIISGHPDIEGDMTLGRIAILARNRFVFHSVERELEKEDIQFYRRLSSSSYQSESDVMKQFELSLRILANPRDRLHMSMLAKSWGIDSLEANSLSQLTPDNGLKLVHSLADKASSGLAPAVICAIEATKFSEDKFLFTRALSEIDKFANKLGEEDKAFVLQDTDQWKKQWDCYIRNQTTTSHGIAPFLGQVALGATQQAKEDGVALLTVHSAKGMEFDVIFLIGMVDGVFPDYRAKGTGLEEERRSAFVAVTRAKRLLFVSYPKLRVMPWGDRKTQKPSKYVLDIFASN